MASQIVGRWTLATADTAIAVGATDEGQLCVIDLRNTVAQKDWVPTPSVLVFADHAEVDGERLALKWQFCGGATADANERSVTIRFACNEPALELESRWQAFPGRGPVRHSMFIRNAGPRAVSLGWQPSMGLDLLPPGAAAEPCTLWSFHSDGFQADETGVYRARIGKDFRQCIDTRPNKSLMIPLAVIDAGGHGLYVGVEWSYCRITVQNAERMDVRAGDYDGFRATIEPGGSFVVPPTFVGAYVGDVDDAGNGLRRYLFSHSMPGVIRENPGYPTVAWNAFAATGDERNSWNCLEKKFYPLIEDIAPLGFEEVMVDVGWWAGGTAAPEPVPDPVDWPSGMKAASEYVKRAGLRFGLYWNKGEDMSSSNGRERRKAHVKRLYEEHGADMWRSDCTAGEVVGDSHDEVSGFYDMLDELRNEIPNFQWENCSAGGQIKDYGAMRRAVKIFNTDRYKHTQIRQSFHDSSLAFHPAQILGSLGLYDKAGLDARPEGRVAMLFAFRTTSMGAPSWFFDAPNGGNSWGAWTQDEKEAIRAAVATYKERIRPLVRAADLYHIFPRPNGKDWDGIQYHDPETGRGVVYIFKPSDGHDTQRIRLRGLDGARQYRVTFEDGSNPEQQKNGTELMAGLDVTLKGAPVSELMFTECLH